MTENLLRQLNSISPELKSSYLLPSHHQKQVVRTEKGVKDILHTLKGFLHHLIPCILHKIAFQHRLGSTRRHGRAWLEIPAKESTRIYQECGAV